MLLQFNDITINIPVTVLHFQHHYSVSHVHSDDTAPKKHFLFTASTLSSDLVVYTMVTKQIIVKLTV